MSEQSILQLPEGHGYGSVYEYVEQVLDTPFFEDEVRTSAAHSGELTAFEHAQRYAVGMSVARTIARARWQQRMELSQDAAYQQASVAERHILAAPQHEVLDDLRAALEPHRHRLQYLNSLDRYIERTQTGPDASVLREGQHDVFHALKDFLSSAGQPGEEDGPSTLAGYIKMPTGMGKTVVAIEMVRAMDYPKTLILTSRKDILKQTVGQNGNRGFSQFAPDTHVTSYYQGDKDLSGNVVVMTYASFNNLLAKGELDKSAFDLLICDEAHQALGTTTSANVRTFSEGKIAVGLTATDEYAENKKVEQLLPECIYEIGLRECINNGWLSPAQAWVYKTNVEIDQDARHEFSSAELRRLSEVAGRNQKGVEFAKNFVEQGLQGIISCIPGENVKHAEDMATALRETDIVDPATGEIRKIRAREMRGEMSEQVRQEIYEQFEAGEIDVLTFVDMLTMGWDSHKAKFLINLRPTCSPVFGTQRLGRILRPTGEGLPAQVVDFVDVTKKAQFTALHALGEYRYKIGKIYASESYIENNTNKRITLPEHLQQHINGVNMRKVADIIVGRPYEADYSELLSIRDVAQQFSLVEAALLLIADENDITIHQAQGGLGAPTAQIREIDRDKLTRIVDTRYEWLKDQSAEWVQEYILRREARLREVQARVTAEVVETHTEGLRSVAADEQHDNEKAAEAEAERLNAAEEELITKYEDKDIDKLITALSKGKLSGDVFKRVIERQTRSGTIKPLTIVRLSMGGKQGGLLGEVQETLVHNLMQKPHLAMAAINIAKQMGQIREVTSQEKPRGMITRWQVETELADGTMIAAEGAAAQGKIAQQVAAVLTIAQIAGIDMQEVVNPHLTPDIEDVALPVMENPKADLHDVFKDRPDDVKFYAMGSIEGDGGGYTYYSKVIFKIKGRSHEAKGLGETYKEAQQNAALRAFALHGEALRTVNALNPTRVAQLEQRAKKMNPVAFLTDRSTRLKVKPPKFGHIDTDEGRTPTVTFVDNFGTTKTFEGAFVPYVEGEEKTELRKRVRAARETVCRRAIYELYPRLHPDYTEDADSAE